MSVDLVAVVPTDSLNTNQESAEGLNYSDLIKNQYKALQYPVPIDHDVGVRVTH